MRWQRKGMRRTEKRICGAESKTLTNYYDKDCYLVILLCDEYYN